MRGYVHRAGADGKAERSAAYIALGTNFGGNLRLKILEDAIESIQKEIGSIDACSCLYESLPGYDVVAHQKKETHDLSLPLHLNAVLRVKTNTTDPNSLLEILQAIELKHGRDRSSTAVRLHRKLDLDLLFFQDAHANTIEIQTEKLTLPHPRLHNRNFVLFPLCDIQPDLVHPPTRKQIKDLLVENLQRREEVLKGACSSSSDGNTAPAVYTLDGNLAIPRRCFALNGHQLWTVKGGAEAAVSDTLRWIEEVLKKYEIKENNAASDTPPPAFADTLLGLRRFLLQEPRGPRLMGVLNVTPDSFSDGLKFYNNVEAAMQHAQRMIDDGADRMIDDGADVIDVGGEARNPYVQEEVSVHSEIQRVVPVIEAIRKEIGKDFVISVDTRRSPVAEAAVAAGADLVSIGVSIHPKKIQ
ncbi:hydroxymethyldihydropterin pyrophosphokinase-dihydropteroate synthase, putative [Eimeria mitis]|uniref:2-amino-4-hydroxy-6-hydroxymethyldihydropteridine diphosphokinase n=1 Tax=Eimeria mitis TaxID=44415 RepID=U6K6T1_9EIME|nr:hydroxymethyldihydropterin pyrophosphokinase-dihydropteroate synthase, putative [Eimeria mitis]CDJ33679.1 hydroxymethyldihydropterin pyrophosphokinase-dihydropteroate synthase, putative [Eimeria mitis]